MRQLRQVTTKMLHTHNATSEFVLPSPLFVDEIKQLDTFLLVVSELNHLFY